MNIKELKQYKRDALLGALGAFLMLVGDLCLSVIPAKPHYARNVLCLRGNGSADYCKRFCGTYKQDSTAARYVRTSYDSFSDYICVDSGYTSGARRRCIRLGFCAESWLRKRGALYLDACKRRLGG